MHVSIWVWRNGNKCEVYVWMGVSEMVSYMEITSVSYTHKKKKYINKLWERIVYQYNKQSKNITLMSAITASIKMMII